MSTTKTIQKCTRVLLQARPEVYVCDCKPGECPGVPDEQPAALGGVPTGYIFRHVKAVQEQRDAFPGEEPDYLWRYMHGTKHLERFKSDSGLEVVELFSAAPAQDAPSAQDARDAARYRWLLETCGDRRHGMPQLDAAWDDDIDDWRPISFWSMTTEEDINAAIDTAMAGGESEGEAAR